MDSSPKSRQDRPGRIPAHPRCTPRGRPTRKPLPLPPPSYNRPRPATAAPPASSPTPRPPAGRGTDIARERRVQQQAAKAVRTAADSLVRVASTSAANYGPCWSVVQGVSIEQQHLAEPGLVVLDIAAADEETVQAVTDALDRLWATSGTASIQRVPGEPGVRARLHADVRRRPGHGPALSRDGVPVAGFAGR